MIDNGLTQPYIRMFNGLKIYYQQVLERPDYLAGILLPKRAQKIPDLLTRWEVGAILQATTNIKYLTLLSVCYTCGLRTSEVVALMLKSIDPETIRHARWDTDILGAEKSDQSGW